jgi:hypothetical protein
VRREDVNEVEEMSEEEVSEEAAQEGDGDEHAVPQGERAHSLQGGLHLAGSKGHRLR